MYTFAHRLCLNPCPSRLMILLVLNCILINTFNKSVFFAEEEALLTCMILVKDFQWDPSPNSLDPNLTSICGMCRNQSDQQRPYLPTHRTWRIQSKCPNVRQHGTPPEVLCLCFDVSLYALYKADGLIVMAYWSSWLQKNRFQPWKNNNYWTPCLSPSGRSYQIQSNSLNLSEKRQRNERPTTTHEKQTSFYVLSKQFWQQTCFYLSDLR